jgi:hypothetical protein
VTTHQGVDILTGPSEESGWFGFLNNTMVVGGGADAVRAAIDRWRAGSRGDPAVAAKAAELSSRYDAWALMLGSPAMLAGRVPDATVSGAMKGDVIQAIEQMSGGLTFGAEVVISAEAMTRTDQDATVLADVIRFLFSMAQLHGNPETAARFAELARKMELTTVSNRVNFSLSIPEAQFEELFRMLPTKPHTRRAGAVDQAGEPD